MSRHAFTRLVLATMLASCSSKELAPSEVLVIIGSDLEVGPELAVVGVSVVDADTRELVDTHDFTLSGGSNAGGTSLPLSFTVAQPPSGAACFRLEVAGYGPPGAKSTREVLVKSAVIPCFRRNHTVQVGVLLARACVGELCGGDPEQTCIASGPEGRMTARCAPVPIADDLRDVATPDDPTSLFPPLPAPAPDAESLGGADASALPPPDVDAGSAPAPVDDPRDASLRSDADTGVDGTNEASPDGGGDAPDASEGLDASDGSLGSAREDGGHASSSACADGVCACADPTLCPDPAFPCAPVDATRYACVGRFADWPMPDALPSAAVPPSYAIEGQLVVDRVTGLAWQRAIPSVYAGCTGIQVSAGDSCTWAEAKAYCAQLTLDDEDDFRLPSKVELESIADQTRSSPSIDGDAFPGTPNLNTWTSSPFLPSANVAWLVNFYDGTTNAAVATTALRVRCVRGTPSRSALPGSRYVADESQDTLLDTATGLVWQRTANATKLSWSEAKGACAALPGGFRLPSIKELLTLVDPNAVNPALDQVFGELKGEPTWSSSPSLINYGRAYYVAFANGAAVFNNTRGALSFRCVR